MTRLARSCVVVFAAAALSCRAPPSSTCAMPTVELTVAPNLDDDDGDGRIDGLERPPPLADDDVVSVTFEVPAGCTGSLVADSPQGELRLWRRTPEGWVATSRLVAGRQSLGVDVVRGRSPHWAGTAVVTAAGAAGQVRVKVPPVVLRTPETPVAEVWVTEVTAQAFEPTSAFVAQLAAALPEGVSVRRLPGDAARADRWVQDAFQAATVDGRPLVIRMPRAGPTQGLGLLSQGAGLPSGVGVLGTGTFSDSRFNYGGNVEVLSPHPRFTQGRLLVGDSVDPALGSWFEAQGVQTPAIKVPTAWLASGHVDDVMLPLPSSPGRVRVLLASTKAGMRLANQAPAAPAPWRQRAFAEFNEACQRQLDAAEATVRAALAPTELDVVPLPVVFAPRVVDGQTLAVSALANPVNALVVGGTAIVGAPDVEPAPLAEAWRRAVEEALSAASLTVHWVDVASLTRHGGSVHCATEAVAAPQPRSGAD